MSNVEMNYDRPEVLVVPHYAIEEFFKRPSFISDVASVQAVINAVLHEGRFVDRDWAESNPCVKQVVSYGVVYHGQQILCLRRSRMSSRESLKLRYTLLVGGHVDSLEKSSSNPLETCLFRELREELGLAPVCTPSLFGIAVDPTTNVGQLHLGIVFGVPIESATIYVPSALDNAEFVNASGSNTYELKPIEQILGLRFDSWSALFLASDVCEDIFGRSDPNRFQLRLPLHWVSHQ